jgi:hypothetical protein
MQNEIMASVLDAAVLSITSPGQDFTFELLQFKVANTIVKIKFAPKSELFGLYANGKCFATSKNGKVWTYRKPEESSEIIRELVGGGFIPLPNEKTFQFTEGSTLGKCEECDKYFLTDWIPGHGTTLFCDSCLDTIMKADQEIWDNFYDPTGGTAPEGLNWKDSPED